MKGSIIWQWIPELDREIDMDDFLKLPQIVQKNILLYARKDWSKVMLNVDDTKFINHSKEPNIGHIVKHNWSHLLIACKDIAIWDELLDDYDSFDSWFAIYNKQF